MYLDMHCFCVIPAHLSQAIYASFRFCVAKALGFGILQSPARYCLCSPYSSMHWVLFSFDSKCCSTISIALSYSFSLSDIYIWVRYYWRDRDQPNGRYVYIGFWVFLKLLKSFFNYEFSFLIVSLLF